MRRTLSYFGLLSLLVCSVTSERLRRSSGYVGGGGFGFGGGGSAGFDYGGGGGGGFGGDLGGGLLTGSLVNGFDAIHRGVNVMLDKFHSGKSHFEDFSNRGGASLGGGMGAGGGASSGGGVRDGVGLGGNDKKMVYVKSDDGRSGGFAFSGSLDGGNGRYGGGGGYSSWGGGRSYEGGAGFDASTGGGVNKVKIFDRNQGGAGSGFGSGGFTGSVRPSGRNAGSGNVSGAGFGGSTGSRPSQGGSGDIGGGSLGNGGGGVNGGIQGGVVLEPSPSGVCVLEGYYEGNGNGHGVVSGAQVRRGFESPDRNVPHLQPTSTYKQSVLQTKYQTLIPVY